MRKLDSAQANTTVTVDFAGATEKSIGGTVPGYRPTGKSYFNAWIEWQEILAAAEGNSAVRQALEQLITLHRLAKEHTYE